MEADFSGWATKTGLECSDGRTITPSAFKDMDKVQVPLVWQHGHNSPENILGHVMLEAREGGTYCHGYFNTTSAGQSAKALVQHKDITMLSIYANQLVERAKKVLHGKIREVSLVLSGANPGAVIESVNIRHSNGDEELLEEDAIIHTGIEIELQHEEVAEVEVEETAAADVTEEADGNLEHAASADLTVQDVYDTFNEPQLNVINYMLGAAIENALADAQNTAVAQSAIENNEGDLSHQEGTGDMTQTRNVFEQSKATEAEKFTLSHDDVKGIVADAIRGGSFRGAVEAYVLKHGITSIDVLFPDAQNINNIPELNKRRTEWVASVLNSTRHTPFSRVKTIVADLTQDEARAKGYIKGNYKLEEWFGVTKRTTTPTTVYKKQQIDRDDMLDITDFDVVAFLMAEIRLMLDEEIARAILIGDGRTVGAVDKIKDPLGASDGAGIRSILNDHELFVTTLYVNTDDPASDYDEVVDAVMDGMEFYKGTGTPVFYTTIRNLNMFLKAKDTTGVRLYKTKTEVADALGVSQIITVEPMNEVVGLIGIIVNLSDYNTGTDKGGEISQFEQFDIDYNQQKYLMETRLSGALTKVKSALVIMKTAAANVLVEPNKPAFVSSTGVVTIPTQTGVVYKDSAGATITAGAMSALALGASVTIYSVPASGYYFPNTHTDSWMFKRPLA